MRRSVWIVAAALAPVTAGALHAQSARTESPAQPPRFITQVFENFRARLHPQLWILSQDDYPSAAEKAGVSGTTTSELVVGPDGRVKDCKVTTSSGSTVLDETTCQLAIRRGRLYPATDQTGRPITGRISYSFRWVLPKRE